jgi:hypothetical protein
MSKKIRTILFILIAALFLLTTPLIILYSQGYRFDFDNRRVVQTGAFSFKVWPRPALIFIDGRLSKKTDFIFGTAYIENLLPKKYTVEIKKEGYLTWEKTLEIRENWATENKNIFLIPEDPQFNLSEKEVENFFLSPNGKKSILKKDGEEGWTLTILDLRNNISSPLLREKDLSEKKEKIKFIDLKWSPDSKKILLKIGAKEERYFVIEIDEVSNLYPLDFLGEEAANVTFLPGSSQRILFSRSLEKKNNLFSADYKAGEISGPILNAFLAFEVFDNSLFWLEDKGFLNQSDFSGNKIRQLNREALSLNLDSRYQLFPLAEDKIFLKERDKFYLFNQGGQLLEKISDGVREAKISADSKKIVYSTDNEIWILFLEKIEEQPQKAKGEKLFLARFSEKIGDLFWLTSHYLIFSAEDRIKITEIDDRDRINTYDLFGFENQKIFWNKYDKRLYILSQGNLFSSEKLLP